MQMRRYESCLFVIVVLSIRLSRYILWFLSFAFLQTLVSVLLVALSPSSLLTFHSCLHSFRTPIRSVVRPRRVRRRLRVAAAARRVDSDQSDDCVARAIARPTPRRPAVDVVLVASIVVIIVIIVIVVLVVVCGRIHRRRTRSPRGRARVQTLAVRAGMECDGFGKGVRIISGRTVVQIFSAIRFFKDFFQRYFSRSEPCTQITIYSLLFDFYSYSLGVAHSTFIHLTPCFHVFLSCLSLCLPLFTLPCHSLSCLSNIYFFSVLHLSPQRAVEAERKHDTLQSLMLLNNEASSSSPTSALLGAAGSVNATASAKVPKMSETEINGWQSIVASTVGHHSTHTFTVTVLNNKKHVFGNFSSRIRQQNLQRESCILSLLKSCRPLARLHPTSVSPTLPRLCDLSSICDTIRWRTNTHPHITHSSSLRCFATCWRCAPRRRRRPSSTRCRWSSCS
jgi:hypothetical protein